MLDKDTLIKVRNRDNGTVGYTIPDLGNLRRQFQPNEVKQLTFEELQKLSWVIGGDVILKNYLVIEDNDEAVAALLGEVEPEYRYTETEVKELLEHGTLDQFKDALDFAPQGVIELIKSMSVSLPLNDLAKMKAIKEKTGFDVEMAISINEETAEETTTTVNTGRRAQPIAATEKTTTRRTEPIKSKYNVISKK